MFWISVSAATGGGIKSLWHACRMEKLGTTVARRERIVVVCRVFLSFSLDLFDSRALSFGDIAGAVLL